MSPVTLVLEFLLGPSRWIDGLGFAELALKLVILAWAWPSIRAWIWAGARK